jgi:hypothetical protein
MSTTGDYGEKNTVLSIGHIIAGAVWLLVAILLTVF